MPVYVVRLWLPDRPGALGAVASRIGATGGDVIGIEILERGGGTAVDELVINLSDDERLDLLVREIREVDGVQVESVRLAPTALHDPRLDALDTAAMLVEQTDADELLSVLVVRARQDFEADWAVILRVDAATVLASTGEHPSLPSLLALVTGFQESPAVVAGEFGPEDVALALVGRSCHTLLVGRAEPPFRSRERRQLVALARIAGLRHIELKGEVVPRA